MPEISLPNDWHPRDYQLPLWRYFENGGRHGVAVWHRRAGKDTLAINLTAVKAHQRIGTYWHMLPHAAQGRKVIWNAIDGDGKRLIDRAFPPALRDAISDRDMSIRLKCGSVWQVVGSDNYNALVGGNPVGVVFSEFAIADPTARDFIKPILTENGGWELYIYTPRGRNHGYDVYRKAQALENWYTDKLTVLDTKAVSLDAIDQDRKAGMPEEMIAQEYFCSFDSALVGTYYGSLIADLEKQDRITNVPYDPRLQVFTSWDLGVSDMTTIWFAQFINQEIRLIDYYESSGKGLDHYVKELKSKPYAYADHFFPHDVAAREMGTGMSRKEVLLSLGINAKTGTRRPVADGISAVRAILPRCWFDVRACEKGIDALKQYRREWDEGRQAFDDRPLHDWTSHAADSFRELAFNVSNSTRQASGEWGKKLVYKFGGYL